MLFLESMLLDWDEETYKTIPHARVAFARAKKLAASDEAFDTIRSIFLKHNVQQKVALCVVHRHFDLQQREQLVEYNDVIAPWRVEDSPEYLQPGIMPKNWAFIDDGALFPYEFRFNADVQSCADTNELPFPLTFSGELYDALKHFGIAETYGLVAIENDDFDTTTPPKMEFTAGRTSVLVDMTQDMEDATNVEAAWAFPCSGRLAGAFGPDGGLVKKRACLLQCRGHEDPDD